MVESHLQKSDLLLALKVLSDENFLYRYCQMTNDTSLNEPWSRLSQREKMLRATEAPRLRPEEVVVELAEIVANIKAKISKGNSKNAWPQRTVTKTLAEAVAPSIVAIPIVNSADNLEEKTGSSNKMRPNYGGPLQSCSSGLLGDRSSVNVSSDPMAYPSVTNVPAATSGVIGNRRLGGYELVAPLVQLYTLVNVLSDPSQDLKMTATQSYTQGKMPMITDRSRFDHEMATRSWTEQQVAAMMHEKLYPQCFSSTGARKWPTQKAGQITSRSTVKG